MRFRMAVVLTLVLSAVAGFTQAIDGVITGRVEDTSGARIPGVTITLSSRALQGEKNLVTDESGNYRFPALPPGTYTVRYELPGFRTLVREGIIVEVGKTVTLNVQLEVAALAETVTVTGESPIVDIEQAKIGINFSSVLKDNIVNARNYWALLASTPGIKTTTPDVGGSTMGTQVGYRSYGRSGQVQISLDGVNLTEGTNSGSMYGDYGSWEEVQVAAAGNSAEMNTVGTSVVAVVRSGSNEFHGTAHLGYQDDSFQGKNIDEHLRRRGITAGDAFSRYTDVNLDVGGPIKKDRLWFYTSFRNEYSGLRTELRQNTGTKYVLPASGIAPNLCSVLPCLADSPDGALAGGLFYTRLRNLTVKLNYQLNSSNQLTATANARHKYQPFRGGQGASARFHTADTTGIQDSWFHIFKAQWLSTLSNRTTLDVSVNNFGYYWVQSTHVDAPSIRDIGTSGPTRTLILGGYSGDGTGLTTGGPFVNNRRRWHENAVLSHFTEGFGGSHNLRFGYAIQWEDYRGSNLGTKDHLVYYFENGRPSRIQVANTPIQWRQDSLIQNYFYVQDKWQVGRKLTLNFGVRFDHYTNFLPEQVRESAGGNPFARATDITGLENFGNKRFPKRHLSTFNNLVPRVSFIYDVFGNGRTAIKASYGRFSNNPGEGLANLALDNNLLVARYTWDGTLPFTPDYLRSCLRSGTCRILEAPRVSSTRIDPNLRNSFIDEYTFGIDQQFLTDWNLRFNFVRKIDQGGYGDVDVAYALTDYRPFQFRDPGRDGRPGTADDRIVTAYNRAVPARPTDTLVTFQPGAGSMFRTWEIEAVRRFSNRFQLIAGADWTKRDLRPEYFDGGTEQGIAIRGRNPNVFVTHNLLGGEHYREWTGKLLGTYEIPYGIKFSSVYKMQKGEAHNRTIRVDCDRLVPVGQTCAQAGGRAPAQGAFNLTAETSGSGDNFYPTWHLWDFRVAKEFELERWGRVEAMFDVFNILNQNTIQAWTTTSSTTTNRDGSVDTTFRRPSRILSPRIFRLGLRWNF